MSFLRIGLGYDVHAFAEGRRLVLGGVEFPGLPGLAGHSDADVVTHAVMDAILGAMRASDIGHHFPDTDPTYRDASSIALLREVSKMMRDGGYVLVDLDIVIVAEEPKVAPHRDEMRGNLAEALGVGLEGVGVKATTTEGLGATGRKEGIAAYAVALLERAG